MGKTISKDRAFSYMLLKIFFDTDYQDAVECVTDGANDGGIGFVYYDEEEAKVILCQCKYTQDLDYGDIVAEIDKMYSTVKNFRIGATGSYNEKVCYALQNALDRLPDENSDNIEYDVFTIADIDPNQALRKLESTQHLFPTEAVSIITSDAIEKEIQNTLEALSTVADEKIVIDKPHNFLNYESDTSKGIMCNVSSKSIIRLYNKYAGRGLFDLNIRKYIKNAMVDNGINRTLDKDRQDFWFLNNGIIIACKEFSEDGNTIRLYNFSIVNGGQTTTLIGSYKGSNKDEFFIPCKIVAAKDERRASQFFTDIAEATNSQKPILAKDLKANAPEMLRLGRLLKKEGVYLEIKRGTKKPRGCTLSLKNDELGQLILSFVNQKPGTSRSGKRSIFESTDIYASIYKVDYFKDADKKAFLLDLIKLNDRYEIIKKELFSSQDLSTEAVSIVRNGKQAIIAMIGVCYRLINGDVTKSALVSSPTDVRDIPFTYGAFISNYHADDFDSKLKQMITDIVLVITDTYVNALNANKTTSVSNFLKLDNRYYENIVKPFGSMLSMIVGRDLMAQIDILKR
ncbi:MAG: AIPR family protein [Lachnospiraceae bacterium]|nr:AIPR family protein [Lachnospiraceae bacterium]